MTLWSDPGDHGPFAVSSVVMRRLLILTSLVGLVALPAAAHARNHQRMLFEAPRELRSDDAALRARSLDEIQGFGVNWLRVVLYWNDVAPRPDTPALPRFDERDPASYDWTRYDRMIDEAHARGMHLLVTISGPVPRWATKYKDDHLTRPNATRFGRFTQAVARHYGTRVSAYAIWNEPNHPAFLKPQWTGHGSKRQATSAKLYRQLFRKGAAGLAAGGARHTPVLFGETAPRGTGHVVHPIIFLRTALCLDAHWHKRSYCGRLAADGCAHHAYTTAAGPYFVPPSHNDVTIGVLGRLNSALARAGRAGAVRKGLPIWLTEFGIQSCPDHLSGVSETTQAEYRAISERIAYGQPARHDVLAVPDARRRAHRREVRVRALRRFRVGPAPQRRRPQARLRGIPAAARRDRRAQPHDAVGPRAPGPRPDARVDRLPAPRSEALALPQARQHRQPRPLEDDDGAALGPPLPGAVERRRRPSLRRPPDPRAPQPVTRAARAGHSAAHG